MYLKVAEHSVYNQELFKHYRIEYVHMSNKDVIYIAAY